MVYQSKMNAPLSPEIKYKEAIRFMRGLPLFKWVPIDTLPCFISYEVIDIIDRNLLSGNKVIFDETFTLFMILHNENDIEEIRPVNKYSLYKPSETVHLHNKLQTGT